MFDSPDMSGGQNGWKAANCNRGAAFVSALLQVGNSRTKGKRRRGPARRYGMAAVGEEAVADDLGLLLEPVAVEAPPVPIR